MKSFKQYILEETQKSPRIFRTEKILFNHEGRIVPIDKPSERHFHHINKVVESPELFGLTDDDISKMSSGSTIRKIKQGLSWDNTFVSRMNDRGIYRGFYRYQEPFTTNNGNYYAGKHSFQLEDDRGREDLRHHDEKYDDSSYELSSLDHLHDHIRHILNIVPKHEDVRLQINTVDKRFSPELIEKLQSKHQVFASPHSLEFENRDSLQSYMDSVPAKRIRNPRQTESGVSSSQMRAAMGQRPENISQAQWNFMRTIGDSYNFSNLFGEILSESASEGIYGAMHRSILDRIASHMQQNYPNLPISKENIKNVSAHDVLLSPRPEKNRSEMRINTWGDYKDKETGEVSDREQIYSFKIYPGGGERWHGVNVMFTKIPMREYHQQGTVPFKTSIAFSINGAMSHNAIPSHDTESMSEVYQGVMDAVTHHAMTHNLTDKDYDFVANADTRARENAKERRYNQMLNLFSGT